MTSRDHNKLLSIFYFVMAGLQILGGIFFAIVYIFLGGAMMSSSSREDEQMMGGLFMGMGILIGIVVLVMGGITLLTAFMVHKQRPIGRTLAIIISILMLISFPIGTALGVYGLWFFFGEGKNFYAGLSGGLPHPPPPPQPGTWQ